MQFELLLCMRWVAAEIVSVFSRTLYGPFSEVNVGRLHGWVRLRE